MKIRLAMGTGLLLAACVGEPNPVPELGDGGSNTSPSTTTSETVGATTRESTSTSGGDGTTTLDASTTNSVSSTGSIASSSDGDSSSSGQAPACPPPAPFSQLVMAADATVEPPAQHREAWGGLAGSPQVAFSFVGSEGLMHFDFEVPCDGTYHVWALVWDRHAGTGYSCGNTPNADSVFVSADDEPAAEQRWTWGCNSCSWREQTWSWARAAEYIGVPCTSDDISYTWTPGIHRITLRNDSEGWDAAPPDVAAVAAIAISDDPGFDPDTLYAP